VATGLACLGCPAAHCTGLSVNSLPSSTPFSRPIATPLGAMDGLIHVVHRRDPRPTPRVPLRRRWRPREVPVHPRG
jgi:hypothetical protein